MDASEPDRNLERAVAQWALPGVAIGCRRIQPGDEEALLEEERLSLPSALTARRRASGAARIVARQLLARFGFGMCPIPKGDQGQPLWPAGITGSLAHDDDYAVAAVAAARDHPALGIDIEPAAPLPDDVLSLALTPDECRSAADHPLGSRMIFAAKEAVFKASYPRHPAFLEFQDIVVDLKRLQAETRAGQIFSLRFCLSSHVAVLAIGH